DGGTRETIAKTIPVNLGKVEVKFYPEGGDLVAGLENRVYFVGRNPLGKPVHVEGKIVDSQNREVTKVETGHKGMGKFAFTPKADEKYSLKIDKPLGIANRPELPRAGGEHQVVLSTGRGVFEPAKPIEVTVATETAGMPLVVSAYCRGVQVGQQAITTKSGTQAISIP